VPHAHNEPKEFNPMPLNRGCILLCLVVAANGTGAAPLVESKGVAAEQCTALREFDLSSTPDAPAQIIAADNQHSSDDTPAYCEVTGYVSPSIRFRLRLPNDRWNGKFVELGCGGTCGTTEHISGCADPLGRGYACIVSDGGNSSSGGDMKWAYNNPQAVVDYVVRASHVTALVGKAIARRYYGSDPRKSYFMGCSAGGLQAMTAAQRFPWDFDGIVAGDPSASVSQDWMNWLWTVRTLIDEHGEQILSQRDLANVHSAVVAKCDLNDGVKDGLIGDPRACSFDPEELSCATRQGKAACLSAAQIGAVRKMYAGPTTSNGVPIGRPFAFKGSELTWADPANPSSLDDSYLPEWFRYYLFQPNPGPSWKLKDFDFDRDHKRFGVAELTEPLNPDLRRFRNAGGKLILYSGWNDTAASVGTTVDYYESAEKVLGGPTSTQTFFRLFVVPGMNHCSGGEGPFAIDYLSYLEQWVENGSAPDKVIGSHIKFGDLLDKASRGDADAERQLERLQRFPLDPAHVQFSRPIFPYPSQAKYVGHGDPNDASNFAPRSSAMH
jgi:hypothetical protein